MYPSGYAAEQRRFRLQDWIRVEKSAQNDFLHGLPRPLPVIRRAAENQFRLHLGRKGAGHSGHAIQRRMARCRHLVEHVHGGPIYPGPFFQAWRPLQQKDCLWSGTRLKDDFSKDASTNVIPVTGTCSMHPDGVSIIASGCSASWLSLFSGNSFLIDKGIYPFDSQVQP